MYVYRTFKVDKNYTGNYNPVAMETYEVGFYSPVDDYGWVRETNHSQPEEAARRVHYLNGGNSSVYTGYVYK
jgi:hypothetical protein